LEQTRPQPWVLNWQPTHDQRSLVPVKLCFGAFKASDSAAGAEDHQCYSLQVTKCRQCVQLGDTLGSIAAQHQTDWLHVYLANPFLPGFNPSHVKVGYNLRLGMHVQCGTRVDATLSLHDICLHMFACLPTRHKALIHVPAHRCHVWHAVGRGSRTSFRALSGSPVGPPGAES
jgi:hypothetical protein